MKSSTSSKFSTICLMLGSLASLSSCGVSLTAPLNIEKTMYITVNQEVLDKCGSVKIMEASEKEGAVLGLLTPSSSGDSSEIPKPYHIGLSANNYPVSNLTKSELDAQKQSLRYYTQITLERAGTYVYRASLSGSTVLRGILTCNSTSGAYPVTVNSKLDVSPSSFYAPVVFRVAQTSDGTLTATLQEFPKGSTPNQLNLP